VLRAKVIQFVKYEEGKRKRKRREEKEKKRRCFKIKEPRGVSPFW
jgi:hypothetical protein